MERTEVALLIAEAMTVLQKALDSLDDVEPVDYTNLPTIPFKDNKEYTPPKHDIERWVGLYGPKFVYETFHEIRNWCYDNPFKQKYCGDYTQGDRKRKGQPARFLGGWLSREWKKRGNAKPISLTKDYRRKFSQ